MRWANLMIKSILMMDREIYQVLCRHLSIWTLSRKSQGKLNTYSRITKITCLCKKKQQVQPQIGLKQQSPVLKTSIKTSTLLTSSLIWRMKFKRRTRRNEWARVKASQAWLPLWKHSLFRRWARQYSNEIGPRTWSNIRSCSHRQRRLCYLPSSFYRLQRLSPKTKTSCKGPSAFSWLKALKIRLQRKWGSLSLLKTAVQRRRSYSRRRRNLWYPYRPRIALLHSDRPLKNKFKIAKRG